MWALFQVRDLSLDGGAELESLNSSGVFFRAHMSLNPMDPQ